MHLRARYYQPGVGRFFQRDPLNGFPTLPQSHNPYTYALNNPVRFTDPSGQVVHIPIIIALGGLLSAGIDYAMQVHHNIKHCGLDFADAMKPRNIDWERVLFSGAEGMAMTALGMFTGFGIQVLGLAGMEAFMLAAASDITVGMLWDIALYGDTPSDAFFRNVISFGFGEVLGYSTRRLFSGIDIHAPRRPAAGVNPRSTAIALYDPEFASQQLRQQGTRFYVRPSGEVIPSRGYRYISSQAPYMESLLKSGYVPKSQSGWYFSFDRFFSPAQAREMLQLPPVNDASIMLEFDTLQIIDDIRIPYGESGTASYLEPLTRDFPDFGVGGGTQAITNSGFTVLKVLNLITGEVFHFLGRR